MNVKTALLTLAVVGILQSCEAHRSGPEVVAGAWGSGSDQFGFADRNNVQLFPRSFVVDEAENIAVADIVNRRIKIYSQNGRLRGIIEQPEDDRKADTWPPEHITMSAGKIVVNSGTRYQIFDLAGKLRKVFVVPDSAFEAFTPDGDVILHQMEKDRYGRYEDRGYRRYSSDGQVTASYASLLAVTGSVKQEAEEKSGVHEEWWIITYEDRVFTIVEGGQHRYARDRRGNLYGISSPPFERYDECGIVTGTLERPGSEHTAIRQATPESVEVRDAVIKYGEPVVSPGGDVYSWKWTPDSYSILRWTWAEKENFSVAWQIQPRNVAAVSTGGGVLVSWDISLQDPACVTGYEIGRSVVSGGPYRKIGSVSKGVLRYLDAGAEKGTSSFYSVRSVISTRYSGYANEAEARR